MKREDALSERIQKRKLRARFVGGLAVVFVICLVFTFWALPYMGAAIEAVVKESGVSPAESSNFLYKAAGLFKVFVGAIAIGCLVMAFVALRGYVDRLLPILNIVILVLGFGLVALTFYAYFAPIISLSGIGG